MATPEGANRLTIYQSILGVIRQQGRDNVDIREAARQVYQYYPFSIHQYQFSSFEAIARRAAYAYEFAAELERNPTRVPDVGEIPTNVGILRPDTPYLYSVVVDGIGQTGQPVDFRLDVYSPTTLSFEQLSAQVMDRISDGYRRGGMGPPVMLDMNPENRPQLYLVSVVRA